MTAPSGTRVNKVKVPSFPYRSRAEAILYDCLSDQERDILSFRGNNYNGDGTQHDQHEKNQMPELIAMNSSGHETQQQQQPHQAQFKQSAHSSDDKFEGLDAEWLEYVGPDEIGAEKPNRDNVAAILYFHGGGYYSGSKEEHRVMIGPLVKRLGKNIRIFIINYRLAPQNPFPAALVDALSSYMWLLDQSVSETFSLDDANSGNGLDDKFQPNQIIFMGDSAGGGLALSLSLLLRDHGSLPQPLSIVTWSPWLDLTQSLPSFNQNALTDCIPYEGFIHKHSEAMDKMFEQEESGKHHGKTVGSKPKIRQRAQVYCPDSCLRMKFVSPMFETDYRGIPSVFITCGSAERFTSECILMAARLEEQQQPCRIDIHEDMPHVFPLFRFHPSASTALDRTSSYIRDVFRESRANAFEDDIVIPISSASSSAFSSRASSPVLPSDQSEQFAAHASLDFSESVLICPKASVAIDVTRGLTRRPYDINRTDSLSSLSSSASEETASATSPSLFSRALSRSKRASHSSVYSKEIPEALVDANMTARLPIKPAAKIRATVNVLNISGNSVMSFHRRDRYGHCDDPMSQQRRRRRSRLTLRDVVSDATLFEWEILLKQGYIPTRHWPHRPSPKK
ncbi:hypothetical protein BGX21_006027 [Mortierella sp. AD011]|nr:hypothetical protein BGX20_008767 [Mortierella sp. AD010]KAF9403956.1 hypothetical protein BGX21_006027 [Mortierella sp. AD011]